MFKTKQKMPPYHTKIKQWIQFQPININTSPQSLLVFVVPFSFTHQKKKKKEMQNGQNSDSSPSPLIDTTNAHNLENQTTITRTKRIQQSITLSIFLVGNNRKTNYSLKPCTWSTIWSTILIINIANSQHFLEQNLYPHPNCWIVCYICVAKETKSGKIYKMLDKNLNK